MNKPLDPDKARQARQGKPVLAILVVSLVLAIIAGWILWGAAYDETGSAFMEPDTAPIESDNPTS